MSPWETFLLKHHIILSNYIKELENMEWATDAFDKPQHCAFVESLLKSSNVCSFSKLLALLILFIPLPLQDCTYWLYFLFYSLLPTALKIPSLHDYKNYQIHMNICMPTFLHTSFFAHSAFDILLYPLS